MCRPWARAPVTCGSRTRANHIIIIKRRTVLNFRCTRYVRHQADSSNALSGRPNWPADRQALREIDVLVAYNRPKFRQIPNVTNRIPLNPQSLYYAIFLDRRRRYASVTAYGHRELKHTLYELRHFDRFKLNTNKKLLLEKIDELIGAYERSSIHNRICSFRI